MVLSSLVAVSSLTVLGQIEPRALCVFIDPQVTQDQWQQVPPGKNGGKGDKNKGKAQKGKKGKGQSTKGQGHQGWGGHQSGWQQNEDTAQQWVQPVCYKCNQPGHKAYQCWQDPGQQQPALAAPPQQLAIQNQEVQRPGLLPKDPKKQGGGR